MYDNLKKGGRMPDRRNLKTIASVKEALLVLLKRKRLSDVTVTDISAAANISRSTFYCNFRNVHEVYELLVEDFLRQETKTLKSQISCEKYRESTCAGGADASCEDARLPYCVAVRRTVRYREVTREAEFLPSLLRITRENDESVAFFAELGVEPAVARSLLTFQMAGCHAAALDAAAGEEWPACKSAIDAFIAGGMDAVRSRLP